MATPSNSRACSRHPTPARDLYDIGVPAMEAMLGAMQQGPGVIAARQAGAGFGGCMVALVDPVAVEDFIAQVTQHYTAATTIEPSIYAVRAASGAGIV